MAVSYDSSELMEPNLRDAQCNAKVCDIMLSVACVGQTDLA